MRCIRTCFQENDWITKKGRVLFIYFIFYLFFVGEGEGDGERPRQRERERERERVCGGVCVCVNAYQTHTCC